MVVVGTALGFLVTSSVLAADKPPTKKPPSAAAKDGRSLAEDGRSLAKDARSLTEDARSHRGAKAAKQKSQPAVVQPLPEGGNEAIIEKALAQPTVLEFTHQPLTRALDYVRDYHSQLLGHPFEIRLDTKALNDAGVATDTPITMSLRGVPLRSALDLMLKELKLKWTIYDEVLLITTPDEAEFLLTTRVLDVADLVVCRNSNGKLWDNYDSLIDLIKSTVLPTEWDDVGGPGSIAPADFGTARALVISQSYRGQCEIADVLAKIRAIAKKTPDVGPPVHDKNEGQFGSGFGVQTKGQYGSGFGVQTSPGASKGQNTKGGTHSGKEKH
jgi:hypothetical protein